MKHTPNIEKKNRVSLSNITKADLEPLWSIKTVPISKIAETLGVTPQAVGKLAQRLGLPPRKGNFLAHGQLLSKKTKEERLFKMMWNGGVKTADIADYFGLAGLTSVNYRRQKYGLTPRSRDNKPEQMLTLAEFHQLKFLEMMKAIPTMMPNEPTLRFLRSIRANPGGLGARHFSTNITKAALAAGWIVKYGESYQLTKLGSDSIYEWDKQLRNNRQKGDA